MNFYSQHGEDFLLDKMFGGKKDGFFVEVGCIDGRRFSNTLHFEEEGWRGLCIEAHPDYIDLLRKNRPGSIVRHCAVGEDNKDSVVFYANSRGSLSTLDGTKEDHFRENYGEWFSGFEETFVPQKRLDSVFAEERIQEIDLLSIDVEGTEAEVLRGIDFGRYRPTVIVIEANSTEDEDRIDRILLPAGYRKSVQLHCNRFYLLDPAMEKAVIRKRFEITLIHTGHPLDKEGDKITKTVIDTSRPGALSFLMANTLFSKFAKRRAIKKALNCKGWTDELKLGLLYGFAKETSSLRGDILEIGSAWGRSTVLLCQASKKKVWSIDPHTGGRAFAEKGIDQDSYSEFIANLKRFGVLDRVTIIKATTETVLMDSQGHEDFCLVFIDGMHTPAGVTTDFNYSYPRLVEGGLMVFDDYFEKTVEDYKETIDGLATEYHLDLITDYSSKLVYFKKLN